MEIGVQFGDRMHFIQHRNGRQHESEMKRTTGESWKIFFLLSFLSFLWLIPPILSTGWQNIGEMESHSLGMDITIGWELLARFYLFVKEQNRTQSKRLDSCGRLILGLILETTRELWAMRAFCRNYFRRFRIEIWISQTTNTPHQHRQQQRAHVLRNHFLLHDSHTITITHFLITSQPWRWTTTTAHEQQQHRTIINIYSHTLHFPFASCSNFSQVQPSTNPFHLTCPYQPSSRCSHLNTLSIT